MKYANHEHNLFRALGGRVRKAANEYFRISRNAELSSSIFSRFPEIDYDILRKFPAMISVIRN